MEHTPTPWRAAKQGNAHKELPILREDGKEIGCIRGEARLGDAAFLVKATGAYDNLVETLRAIRNGLAALGDDMDEEHQLAHDFARAALADWEGA